ncbi:molybdate transporter 2-like [Castanea sativa]|uniref:molybdate transporter 2-like n=1 Tax=Castanea sativa TaxID=21020 RepID=UPI003F64E8A0
MSFLYRFLPLPVGRGVQLSQGLSFAFTAIKYIRYNQDLVTSKSGTPRSLLGFDGLVVALVSLLFLILTTGAGDHHDDNPDDHENQTLHARDDDDDDDDGCRQPRNRRECKRLRFLSSIPSALIVFLVGLCFCACFVTLRFLKI